MHRKNSQPYLAAYQASFIGRQAIEAIKAGNSEQAGALAMFAARWAKRTGQIEESNQTMGKQWVATKDEATKLAIAKGFTNWGIFVTKVNKANKIYTHGYVVSWRELKSKLS